MTRDQYIHKLESDVERWNSQVQAWEEILREAGGERRGTLQRHLDDWREQRSFTSRTLCRMRVTSDATWEDMARDADLAWRELAEAYQRTREAFDRHDRPA